jgi:hypothetical protein
LNIVNIAIHHSNKTDLWPAIGVLAVFATVSVQLLIAAAENDRWASLIMAAIKAGILIPRRVYTLRELFAITTIVAVTMGLTCWLVSAQAWEFLLAGIDD